MNQSFYRQDVVDRLAKIIDKAEYIKLNQEKLLALGQTMRESIETEWWNAYRKGPEYYQLSTINQADEGAVLFTLVNMAQMYLIWEWVGDGEVRPWQINIAGELHVGASGITAAHLRFMKQGGNLMTPRYLREMQLKDVRKLYRDDLSGETTLQDLEGRLEKFNEIGAVLENQYAGLASGILEQAGGYLYTGEGNGVVQQLAKNFPVSFGDFPFFKLANAGMILGLMSLRASGLPATPDFLRQTKFRDLENLEGGADYYRPLFLFRTGVLKIEDKALKAALKNRLVLDQGSQAEEEIRAMTLMALRELTKALGTFPKNLTDVEIETHAQAFLRCRHCRTDISNSELFCTYKPVCNAYNQEPDLMEISWPLVITRAY